MDAVPNILYCLLFFDLVQINIHLHYSHAKIVIIQGRVRGEIFYPFFTFKLLLFWRFEYKFKYLTIITIKYMDYLVG